MGDDSSRDKPVKSSRRKSMDRTWAFAGLTDSELDGISLSRWATVDRDECVKLGFEVNNRYDRIGYCAAMIVTTVCLGLVAAQEVLLTVGR